MIVDWSWRGEAESFLETLLESLLESRASGRHSQEHAPLDLHSPHKQLFLRINQDGDKLTHIKTHTSRLSEYREY